MRDILTTSQHVRASIATYTGVEFFPLAPRFEDIYALDIAHALSNQCRYNGHTNFFYSVGQHCVLVSKWLEENILGLDDEDHLMLARWGLLHDASEAYLPDVCSPIKPLLPSFEAFEEQLHVAVAQRFGLPWPMPGEVKYADKAIFKSELDSGVIDRREWWGLHPEAPDAKIEVVPIPPRESEALWMRRFNELFGETMNHAWCPQPSIP